MPKYRLTKIYTRTGDDGTTGLGGGQRVPKESERIEAYGAVDELNSCIGAAVSAGLEPDVAAMFRAIQNDLFHLGSDLCVLEADKKKFKMAQIEDRHVKQLEKFIDKLQLSLTPLENFILPGGTMGSSQLHVCRCVCRRAERDILRLKRIEPVGVHVVEYVNRLSDLLFVMARYENVKKNTPDILWDQTA